MQFCCDLKGKDLFLGRSALQVLSIMMIFLFSFIIIFQYFHFHSSASGEVDTSIEIVVKKADHCKICENFLYSHTALAPHGDFSEVCFFQSRPIAGGFHIFSDYSTIIHSFTNKGPPSGFLTLFCQSV
jgi:hypothetical protein